MATCEAIVTAPLKLVLAVDGSDVSTMALNYVSDHLMQFDRASSVDVIHIFDDDKDYLPPAFRKDAIRSIVEAKMTSSVSSKRWALQVLSKAGKPAGTHIVDAVRKASTSTAGGTFAVMGYFGLKGKKDSGLVGSNVYETLKYGRCSLIIIKDTSPELLPIKRPTKFVVSVSLNKAATKAFLDALHLSQPGDEIHVVYVKGYMEEADSDYTAELREKYGSFFSGLKAQEAGSVFNQFHNRHTEFHLVSKQRLETTAQAVVRFADSIDADFLVVGTNALRVERGKEPIGSVSLGIITETSRNVIVANWVDVSARVYEAHVRYH